MSTEQLVPNPGSIYALGLSELPSSQDAPQYDRACAHLLALLNRLALNYPESYQYDLHEWNDGQINLVLVGLARAHGPADLLRLIAELQRYGLDRAAEHRQAGHIADTEWFSWPPLFAELAELAQRCASGYVWHRQSFGPLDDRLIQQESDSLPVSPGFTFDWLQVANA